MCNEDDIKSCEHVCCTSQDNCNKPREKLKIYGMLDFCSQGTFINSKLVKTLRIIGTMTTIKTKTLNGEESQETKAISDLKVTSSTGKNISIDLSVS